MFRRFTPRFLLPAEKSSQVGCIRLPDGYIFPRRFSHGRAERLPGGTVRFRSKVRRLVLGIGIDLIEVARIERLWQRFGSRFLERLYTPTELDYSLRRARPAAALAARFAAKEAVMKALGTGWGGCAWHEIEVVRRPGGMVALNLYGAAARRAVALGIDVWHLSLTHGEAYAAALVVAERR